jgi:hypothetical protein
VSSYLREHAAAHVRARQAHLWVPTPRRRSQPQQHSTGAAPSLSNRAQAPWRHRCAQGGGPSTSQLRVPAESPPVCARGQGEYRGVEQKRGASSSSRVLRTGNEGGGSSKWFVGEQSKRVAQPHRRRTRCSAQLSSVPVRGTVFAGCGFGWESQLTQPLRHAHSPKHECSPYRWLHVRRERAGVPPRAPTASPYSSNSQSKGNSL